MQEYWSGLPFPSPRDPLDPGIEPGSPALPADSFSSETPRKSFNLYGALTRDFILEGYSSSSVK